MPVVPHDVLREFVYNIYRGAGGTEEDARIVSDHVVDSNLAGHDSHGVINAPNYISGMEGGPAADKMEIVRESGAATVINANRALGMGRRTQSHGNSCRKGTNLYHRRSRLTPMWTRRTDGGIPTDCRTRGDDRHRLTQRRRTIYAPARWYFSKTAT